MPREHPLRLAGRRVQVTAGYGRTMAGPDVLRVSRSCEIAVSELQWRFSASGGPGGQHANTSNTRVEVRFDVANSPSLGPYQRARLLERLGPVVRVTADDERSQHRNRQLALDRLRSRLADGLRREQRRVATKPSRGAKERRLQAKHQHGQKKQRRRQDRQRDPE